MQVEGVVLCEGKRSHPICKENAISSGLCGASDLFRFAWSKRSPQTSAGDASFHLCARAKIQFVGGNRSPPTCVDKAFRSPAVLRHLGFLDDSKVESLCEQAVRFVRARDSTRLGACPHLELASPLTLITLGISAGAPRFQHLM